MQGGVEAARMNPDQFGNCWRATVATLSPTTYELDVHPVRPLRSAAFAVVSGLRSCGVASPCDRVSAIFRVASGANDARGTLAPHRKR